MYYEAYEEAQMLKGLQELLEDEAIRLENIADEMRDRADEYAALTEAAWDKYYKLIYAEIEDEEL
jgi:hypothetical protein